MLKWIVGSKVDHPLADPKQARALVAELPSNDATKSLEEITRWLESLNEVEGLKLERLLEIAELLDTAARAHQRKLVQDYLGTSRQQKFQENRLWTCGYKFSKAMGETYLACVAQFRRNPSSAGALKKDIPLVVARGLRAAAMQVKWTMLRYDPFAPRLWASIGELYRYAEEGGYAGTQLAIYPGPQGAGTIRQDYVKVMMLWASSADVLPPLKQDIAERVIAAFAADFRVAPAAFEGALYTFDAANDRPPARLFAAPPAGAGVSFFGPGDAPKRLAAAIATVEQTRAVPSSLNLGAQYPVEAVLPVLKHLALYWSERPPARTSERHATSARITVVPGYAAVIDELERDESDALNFSVSNAETWIVEDVSARGYGALVPASVSEWMRVGEMIGIQAENEQAWGIGIIRRVSRDEQKQYHVGIEVISRKVTLVHLAQGEAAQEREYAVLLSGTPDERGEVGLVMRAGRYDPDLPMEITGRSKSYRFEPARMIDAGEDFDWAMFRVGQTT